MHLKQEEKSPDDGNDAPSDEQQTELECEGDIVDLYAVQKNCRAFYDILDNDDHSVLRQI